MEIRAIAHRGASGYAPENTLASFRLAHEIGAVEIETDVQLSADGVPVLFHDGALDVKTDLSGPVRRHAAAALEGADIGTWFDEAHPDAPARYAGTGLTTLDALLAAFGDQFHYHIELKSLEPELAATVAASLARFGLAATATLTSFELAQARNARALGDAIPVCWLLRSAMKQADHVGDALLDEQCAQIDEAARHGFQMVALRARELSAVAVAHAAAAGLALRAWGVRSEADMEHALAVGAGGMTIDWPDLLLARLGRAR